MKKMIKELKKVERRVRELEIYGDDNAVANYIEKVVQGMLARMTTEDLVLTGCFIYEAIDNREKTLRERERANSRLFHEEEIKIEKERRNIQNFKNRNK